MSHSELRDLKLVEKLIQDFKLEEAIGVLDELIIRERHDIPQKVFYQYR